MKKRKFVSLSILGLIAFSAFSGQIKWSGPYEISGDAGVRQNGELLYAYAGSGESATVNGVAFKGAKGAHAWDDAITMEFASVDSKGFGKQIPTSEKLSASMKAMLLGAPWCDNKPVKVTLKRLTAGKAYLVQVWVNDSRELACERTAKLDDGKVVLFFNKGDEATCGTYALGVFVADGAEQSFSIQGNQSSQMNAIQVRAIESADVKLDLPGEVIAKQLPGVRVAKAKTKVKNEAKVEVKDDPSRPVADAAKLISPAAVERAITFLGDQYGKKYDVVQARAALSAYQKEESFVKDIKAGASPESLAKAGKLIGDIRASMLANPALDADRIVFIRRILGGNARNRGERDWGSISLNSHTHVTINKNGWHSQIVELSNLRGEMKERVIREFNGPLVRDMQLSCDAKTVSYTSVDANNRFAVYELALDGQSEPVCVSPQGYPDVDWFDGVSLPDGRYIMLSTASYQGLPCESGSKPMAQVYQYDPKTKKARQLTFDQDSDYTPSVMEDGRVMFTRWEYCDLPHYFSRVLMTMNPDGTSQTLLWGSGSYYPTTLLQVRQIPGTTKLAGIVSGHHDVKEIGRLVLLDPSMARYYPFKPILTGKTWGDEGDTIRIQTQRLPPAKTGMLQEIPGYGEYVEADVCDSQAGNQHQRGRPFFVYPCPLNLNFHLVTAQPKDGLWGLYLVDTFDNMTLVKEYPDSAILHALLVQPKKQPRVIPDRVNLASKTATVHITDIYNGAGLVNVPRGTVSKLRIFSYHFAYMRSGGHASVGRNGVESGWDVKRLLGTVDIEADGSVCFEVPANIDIAVQPLDKDGAALQIMRSWFVGMPGERVSCSGCHEDNRLTVPTKMTVADKKKPQQIKTWYGPTRAMTFELDVWPAVQKYCAGCHDKAHQRKMTDAETAYDTIQPYVRRPGPESELLIYPPMDWHVSTSPLFQMLRKGHHNVKPDAEFYERVAAWVDLNCPWRGKWAPPDWENQKQVQRRIELTKVFANMDLDAEKEFDDAKALLGNKSVTFVAPEPYADVPSEVPQVKAFPMSVEQAVALQKASADSVTREIMLNATQKMTFVRIPAGSFVMGNAKGYRDEKPLNAVTIDKPFWMSTTEVRNRDYALFDAEHDSRYIDEHGKDHAVPGYIANHPDQPVVRISWKQAMEFSAWFSKAYKVKAMLPTEAQWEYAARAGSDTQFFYGDADADFGPYANLADKDLQNFYTSWDGGSKIHKRRPYKPEQNYPLYDSRFKDNWFVVDYVAQAKPNAWGLYDMVGNANEWTRSDYQPYPYKETNNSLKLEVKKVARGGSWACRPRDAGSAVRYPYEAWQGVHDVSFRIILED